MSCCSPAARVAMPAGTPARRTGRPLARAISSSQEDEDMKAFRTARPGSSRIGRVVAASATAATISSGVLVFAPHAAADTAPAAETYNFGYTGQNQVFTVPTDVWRLN